jgi:hypothetical protein
MRSSAKPSSATKRTPTSFIRIHPQTPNARLRPAARCARGFVIDRALKSGGRGECRVPAAPAAPCAEKKHTGSRHRSTGITRHSRTRMVLTAYTALSSATSSFLSPSSANWRSREARSSPQDLRRLDTSNGCQDHTVLPSATPFAKAARRAWYQSRRSLSEGGSAPSSAWGEALTGNPPCDCRSCPTLPRPPHPAPNVRDDRDTPLSRDGMRQLWI